MFYRIRSERNLCLTMLPAGPATTSVQLDADSEYREQYERRLDPFARFKAQERERSVQKLNIHDQATLSIVSGDEMGCTYIA